MKRCKLLIILVLCMGLLVPSLALAAEYYPNYTEADQGVVGNGQSAKAYLNTIGSDSGTLVFHHNSGGATTTYAFSTSMTIPPNINVIVEKGAIISMAGGVILTTDGSFETGLYQVFSGAGNVTFSKIGTVYPEWWGIDGTADEIEINKAQAALSSGGIVALKGAIYTISSPIEMLSRTVLQGTSGSDITLPGANYSVSGCFSTTIILANGANSDMVHFAPTTFLSKISGIGFDGNRSNNTGILYGIKYEDCAVDTMTNNCLENVGVYSVNGYGIYGGQYQREGQLTMVSVLYCDLDGIWLHNNIDWSFFRVGCGFNGQSALKITGTAGVGNGAHRIIECDFFYAQGNTDETGSTMVVKGNVSGIWMTQCAVQNSYRHGLLMKYDAEGAPSKCRFIAVLFNGNSQAANATYDQVRFESSNAGCSVRGNEFLDCIFADTEPVGHRPAYAINDQNAGSALSDGNIITAGIFNSGLAGTAGESVNSNVLEHWQISSTAIDMNPTMKPVRLYDDSRRRLRGTTAQRPVNPGYGFAYADSNVGATIYWNGYTWYTSLICIPTSGTTTAIRALSTNGLGYNTMVYNTTTKKPVFWDAYYSRWVYADGAIM